MKILATDLDGTLFYPKDKKNMICHANLFFLQSFIDDGNEVILVSGRSVDYGKKVIEKIGRPCAYIGFNGSCAFKNNEFLFKNTIDNKDAIKFIEEIGDSYKNYGVFLMTDRGVTIKIRSKSNLVKRFCLWGYRLSGVYSEKVQIGDDLFKKELENGNIYKVMLFFGFTKRKMERANEATKFLRNAYDNFEISWSTSVIEITKKGCSKANALEKYISERGLNKEDVYVVGDSGNDISMFKAFHENSFCLGHSPASIKKYAKYSIEKFEDLSRYIYKR